MFCTTIRNGDRTKKKRFTNLRLRSLCMAERGAGETFKDFYSFLDPRVFPQKNSKPVMLTLGTVIISTPLSNY